MHASTGSSSSDDGLAGFDQTNGLVSGLEGESGETQEGEAASEGDRRRGPNTISDESDETFVGSAMKAVYGQPDKAETGRPIPDAES